MPGTKWWPDDDETIHLMGLIIKQAIEIADIHENTVDEVLAHVKERWRRLMDID